MTLPPPPGAPRAPLFSIPPHRILAAVDFTPPGLQAWDMARDLAGVLGAEVEAVHAFEPEAMEAAVPTHGWMPPTREQARKLRYRLSEQLGVGVRVTLVEGLAGDSVLKVAADHWADLIVLGTHGWTRLSRLLFDPVVETVCRRSPVPVVTVRGEWRPVRRILAPLDLSHSPLASLRTAARMARALGAGLDVLSVTPAPPSQPVPVAALEEAARALQAPPRLLMRCGDPAEEIVEAGRGYDLIALRRHRRRPLRDSLHEPTAERVVRRSVTPVLTLPAGLEEAGFDGT